MKKTIQFALFVAVLVSVMNHSGHYEKTTDEEPEPEHGRSHSKEHFLLLLDNKTIQNDDSHSSTATSKEQEDSVASALKGHSSQRDDARRPKNRIDDPNNQISSSVHPKKDDDNERQNEYDLFRESNDPMVIKIKKKMDIYLSSQPATDPRTKAFSLALDRFSFRTSNLTTAFYSNLQQLKTQEQQQQQQQQQQQEEDTSSDKNNINKIQLLNTIRIPKAGSSALSVTGRALAGCHPDGYACCIRRKRNKHVCPLSNLNCLSIVGCTDHFPNYDGMEPIISAFREPLDRHVSAFFYGPPHSNIPNAQTPHSWEKFEEFVKASKFQNIVTKMFSTGDYSYAPYDPTKHVVPKAKQRICSMVWYKLTDKPITSSLLLYETKLFQHILPNPVAFELIPWDDPTLEKTVTNTTNRIVENKGRKRMLSSSIQTAVTRVNSNSEYKNFRTKILPEKNGTQLFLQYNKPDVEIYQHVQKLFCGRLLSHHDLIQDLRKQDLAMDEVKTCETFLSQSSSLLMLNNKNGQPDYNAFVQTLCDK